MKIQRRKLEQKTEQLYWMLRLATRIQELCYWPMREMLTGLRCCLRTLVKKIELHYCSPTREMRTEQHCCLRKLEQKNEQLCYSQKPGMMIELHCYWQKLGKMSELHYCLQRLGKKSEQRCCSQKSGKWFERLCCWPRQCRTLKPFDWLMALMSGWHSPIPSGLLMLMLMLMLISSCFYSAVLEAFALVMSALVKMEVLSLDQLGLSLLQAMT